MRTQDWKGRDTCPNIVFVHGPNKQGLTMATSQMVAAIEGPFNIWNVLKGKPRCRHASKNSNAQAMRDMHLNVSALIVTVWIGFGTISQSMPPWVSMPTRVDNVASSFPDPTSVTL